MPQELLLHITCHFRRYYAIPIKAHSRSVFQEVKQINVPYNRHLLKTLQRLPLSYNIIKRLYICKFPLLKKVFESLALSHSRELREKPQSLKIFWKPPYSLCIWIAAILQNLLLLLLMHMGMKKHAVGKEINKKREIFSFSCREKKGKKRKSNEGFVCPSEKIHFWDT